PPRHARGPGPRNRSSAAVQACAQQPLAQFRALAAVRLGPAEQVGDLGVLGALGVLDVTLQAQCVVQARLDVPDQVVVLVLCAGDAAGLRLTGHPGLLFAVLIHRPPGLRNAAEGAGPVSGGRVPDRGEGTQRRRRERDRSPVPVGPPPWLEIYAAGNGRVYRT